MPRTEKKTTKHRAISPLRCRTKRKTGKRKSLPNVNRNKLYESCGTSRYSLVSVSCVTTRHTYIITDAFLFLSCQFLMPVGCLSKKFKIKGRIQNFPRRKLAIQEVITTSGNLSSCVHKILCCKHQFHESQVASLRFTQKRAIE